MQGQIDATFGTFQRDMFESGLVAELGANAFVVWVAIKSHADFETGKAWPSIRRLCAVTGLADKTVSRCIDTLEAARLLRIDRPGNRRQSTRYVARERLDIRLGDRLLCQIVIDYVPARVREQLTKIKRTLEGAERNAEAFAQVEIVPGDGFTWDATAGVLRAEIPARELPQPNPEQFSAEQFAASALGLKLAGIRQKAKALPKK